MLNLTIFLWDLFICICTMTGPVCRNFLKKSSRWKEDLILTFFISIFTLSARFLFRCLFFLRNWWQRVKGYILRRKDSKRCLLSYRLPNSHQFCPWIRNFLKFYNFISWFTLCSHLSHSKKVLTRVLKKSVKVWTIVNTPFLLTIRNPNITIY